MMNLLAIIPLFLATAPISFDRQSHCVTLTAHPTDAAKSATVEFAFVGPSSDRAYEALFVTDATLAEIAHAFDAAGIPIGKPTTQSGCRFWPVGKHLTITPSVWDFVHVQNESDKRPITYTGGTRQESGVLVADSEMPQSLLSFYRLDQSLLQLDDSFDQSDVYGHFKGNGKAEKGRSYTFTFAWDGASGTESRHLKLEPGTIKEALSSLKGANTDVDVLPEFSPELNVMEAQAAARALAVLDSRAIKINGFAAGQFFYRGFLPNDIWRDRSKRLTQPLEVRVSPTNVTYTVIHENWNVEGIDPELTPKDIARHEIENVFKGDSCLFYVARDEKLARIYALMKSLPKSIVNWYVFID